MTEEDDSGGALVQVRARSVSINIQDRIQTRKATFGYQLSKPLIEASEAAVTTAVALQSNYNSCSCENFHLNGFIIS